MLLVKERNKEGEEVNYLSNLSDYFVQVSKNGSGAAHEMADAARKLYATKQTCMDGQNFIPARIL